LILPILTGHAAYTWLGPYFALCFGCLVAHGIIRHHVMDIRLVVHKSLTFALSIMLSLVPLLCILFLIWPRLTGHLRSIELLILVASVVVLGIIVPFARDAAEYLIDRYLYRKQANYRRTVSDASRMLTRVLQMSKLISFLTRSVVDAANAES